ncbi:MAG: polyphosphate kinase 1 [Planctomycetes bacterium]|nr:polyphosphate kinase 1 [Planctomycetota bacterium]
MDLAAPALYINRELSLLEFNRRVLAQAADASVPLLERLRFLTISCSNMDEFFEIRVAGLKQQLEAGVATGTPDLLAPRDVLKAVGDTARGIIREQYRIFNEVLAPELEAQGIRILRRREWNDSQRDWARDYFRREVFPLLTPIALDPSHPFPNVLNKILNFVVVLEGRDAFGRRNGTAVVQAPRQLPRLIALPAEVAGAAHDFVLLSAIIHANMGELFPGMEVKDSYQFRVTRNSDLWVEEEEVEDLLDAVKYELPRRHYGAAVRLEVPEQCPAEIPAQLLERLHLKLEDLYTVNGPVNLVRLMALYDMVDRPDLKYPPHKPGLPRELAPGQDLFEVIRKHDVLLHHPYQSYSPVVELLRQAAADPAVVAIKGTLYRTGQRSEIADALFAAARSGKEVTAVVELRARFDEAANIDMAERLKNAGANVVYGVVGYKTHSKMMMILRKEGGQLRRYVHLGTGNYHPGTARFYTDLSLLTADEALGEDVHRMFRQLTGLGEAPRLQRLLVSPFSLFDELIARINEQAELARQGQPSRIRAKMNALSEDGVIQALYRASQAGVPIDLVVRGICCLRPGVPGISENIRVRSIVGRFLEHSRIYSFGPQGEHTYAASADWMQRNLFRRVETCFPLVNETLRARVIEECLDVPLSDNCQAWELQPDGTWLRCRPGDAPARSAQEVLAARLG